MDPRAEPNGSLEDDGKWHYGQVLEELGPQ